MPGFIPRLLLPVALMAAGAPLAERLAVAERPAQAVQQEFVLEAIVASVDDKPITLSELNARIIPPRKLTYDQAARDEQARKVLDAIVLERLLEAEATAKKVSVADEEINEYISEVAQKNSLSLEQFESELRKEGQTMENYRKQVRLDIMRSKLMSTMMRGGVSISNTEVDEYIEKHPELRVSGTALKLSVLTISAQNRTLEQVQTKVEEVVTALAAGDPFKEVAQRFSDGPNAQDGGSLGLVAEQDLNGQILQAVAQLDAGQYSKPLASELGVQVFFVEKRFSALDEDEDEERRNVIREEVKATLQRQKSRERLASYFETDLYKNHSVDKKL